MIYKIIFFVLCLFTGYCVYLITKRDEKNHFYIAESNGVQVHRHGFFCCPGADSFFIQAYFLPNTTLIPKMPTVC